MNVISLFGYSTAGQLVQSVANFGDKQRMEFVSKISSEDQMRNKFDFFSTSAGFDDVVFRENSIPIGESGEEIFIDGKKLMYGINGSRDVLDLSLRGFRPMFREGTAEKYILFFLSAICGVANSAFVPNDKRDLLLATMKEYVIALSRQTGDVNFFSKMIRGVTPDYTYEQLDKIYNDYKEGKEHKGFGFSFKKDDIKNRYIDVSSSLDKLVDLLNDCFLEAKNNINLIKSVLNEKLKDADILREDKKSELLIRIMKSKKLLQRFYVHYLENGQNFDVALIKLSAELFRDNSLKIDKSVLRRETAKNLEEIEGRYVKNTSVEESEEQARRYLNFNANTARCISEGNNDILIDRYSKIIEINDLYHGTYYLDFNRLEDDIKHEGGLLYYKTLLREILKNRNDYKYMSNKKNAKIMQYIVEVLEKIRDKKNLSDDENEYMPNMLFHWISSLMNRPVLERDKNKKIVTVTFMDIENKSKMFDDARTENINNFKSISFDIFDPIAEKMKMGTILRKGEKIYYREDPGMDMFETITATELLEKLNIQSLKGKDIDGEYIGDTWNFRKLISLIETLQEKEKTQKKPKKDIDNRTFESLSTTMSDGTCLKKVKDDSKIFTGNRRSVLMGIPNINLNNRSELLSQK